MLLSGFPWFLTGELKSWDVTGTKISLVFQAGIYPLPTATKSTLDVVSEGTDPFSPGLEQKDLALPNPAWHRVTFNQPPSFEECTPFPVPQNSWRTLSPSKRSLSL